MTFRVYFKEWQVGSYVEWTEYLMFAPGIAKNLESEVSGEAGLIGLDTLSLVFRMYEPNGTITPVGTAFNEASLDSKNRLMFKIVMQSTLSSSQQVFEGMADLKSLTYPYLKDSSGDFIQLISFDVMDKFTAMTILGTVGFGREGISLFKYFNDSNNTPTTITPSGSASGVQGSNVIVLSDSFDMTYVKDFNNIEVRNIDGIGNHANFLIKKVVTSKVDEKTGETISVKEVVLGSQLPMSFSDKTTYIYSWTVNHPFGDLSQILNQYYPRVNKISDTEMLISFYKLESVLDDNSVGLDFNLSQQLTLSTNPIEVGSILAIAGKAQYYYEDYNDDSSLFVERDLYLVKKTELSGNSIYVEVVPSTSSVKTTDPIWENSSLDSFFGIPVKTGLNYYLAHYSDIIVFEKEYYGQDFLNTTGTGDDKTATSYDGLALLETLIQTVWSDATLTTDGFSNIDLPLDYFSRLMGFFPFDEQPIDAILELVTSINAYMWFDSTGNPILRKWSDFSTKTVAINLDSYDSYLISGTKQYFWDKLVDSVEVYVKSWFPEYNKDGVWTGYYLDGASYASKTNYAKDRNLLEKTIIATNESLSDYGISINPLEDYWTNVAKLNKFASYKSSELLNFYGKRHYAYILNYNLIHSFLSLNIGDVVTFKSARYFIAQVEFTEDMMELLLVSVTAYDFDAYTILYDKRDSVSGGSSGSVSSNRTAGSAYFIEGESGTGDTTGIHTGTWEGEPIVADYLNFNPHNLDNDYYSGTVTALSKDTANGYATFTFASPHSFRLGATVSTLSIPGITDGDYIVVNVPSTTSVTINTTQGTVSGSSSGTLTQVAHLNTIQDLGLLDMPQFAGIKLDYDEGNIYENYIPKDYVFEVARQNSVTGDSYGYFRLFDTQGGDGEGYGTLDIYLSAFEDEFLAVGLHMNPEEGFEVTHGGSYLQHSLQRNKIKVVDQMPGYTTEYTEYLSTYYNQFLYHYVDVDTLETMKYSESKNYASGSFSVTFYDESTSGIQLSYTHRRGTQAGMPNYLDDNDEIVSMLFNGYSDDYNNHAVLKVLADGDHSATSLPTRFELWTTSIDENSAESRLVIDNQGRLGLGVTSDELNIAGKYFTMDDSFDMGSEEFMSGWMGGLGWWLEAESFSGSEKHIYSATRYSSSGTWVMETITAHGYSVGQRVIISDCSSVPGLNGGYIIQAVTTSTFTIISSASGTYANDANVEPVAYEYNLTVDNLDVRGTMRVWELLVQQIRVTNGNLLVTAGAKSASKMLNDGNNYFEVEDITGHGVAPFTANDIIMCQQVNLGDLSASDFETDDWIEIKLSAQALVKRLVYRVVSVSGLKVYVDQNVIGGLPTNKGIIEEGDSFARIGNTTDIDRQGMLGLFADAKDAPYMRITDGVSNWLTWNSRLTTKVQIGKLDSLGVDQDFGIDFDGMGYGAYFVDNFFAKGNIILKSDNNFDIVDETIALGNVNVEDAILPHYSAIGISVIPGNMEKSGIFGLDSSNNLIFALRLDDTVSPHNISNWKFDSTKLWNTETGNSTTVRLEASDILSGFGIYDEASGLDVVKIGYMSTLTPTISSTDYTATLLNGEGFNSATDLAYWTQFDPYNLITYSTTYKYEGAGSLRWSETEVDMSLGEAGISGYIEQSFSNISNILGKSIDISWRMMNVKGALYQGDNVARVVVSIFQTVGGITTWAGSSGTLHNSEKNNWRSYSFSAKINSSATAVKLRFYFYNYVEGSISVHDFADTYIDLLSINFYSEVYTHISQDGLYVRNSPTNYLKFDGSLSIGTSDLKVNGLPIIKWWGDVDNVDYIVAEAGDMAFEHNGTTNEIKMYSGTQWITLYVSAGGTPAQSIASLTDVNLTLPVGDKDILFYDLANTEWINGTFENFNLSELGDTEITTPLDNYLLQWDSTANEGSGGWVERSYLSTTQVSLTKATYNDVILTNNNYKFRISTQPGSNPLQVLDISTSNHASNQYTNFETSASKFYFNKNTWSQDKIGIYVTPTGETGTFLERGTLSLDHAIGSTLTLYNVGNSVLRLDGKFNAISGLQVNSADLALTHLADVDILSLQNKQMLVYNYTSAKWENDTIKLGDLSDVNVSGVTDGQILVYAAGTWNKSPYPSSDWSQITNKPTTISGYGITDALTTTGADIKTAGSLKFNDSIGLNIGTGTDLNIYASGTTAHIDIGLSSTLVIEQQSYTMAAFGVSSDARLYFGQGSLKLQTENTGVKVTGILNATTGYNVNGIAFKMFHLDDIGYTDSFDLSDGEILQWSASTQKWENISIGDVFGFVLEDADGTEILIDNSDEIKFSTANGGLIISYDAGDGSDASPYRFNWKLDFQTLGTASSQSDIYWLAGGNSTGNTTQKYQTSSFNLSNFNNDIALTRTGADTKSSGSLKFNDNISLYFGSGSDLNIYTSGTTTHMDIISGSTLRITKQDYTLAEFGISNDARLYYGQSSLKLQTTDTGITVTGIVNSTTGYNVNGSSFKMFHLDDIGYTDSFDLSDGEILQWSSTTQKWENVALSGSFGFVLEDADGTEISVSGNDEVKFSNANGGVVISYDAGDGSDLSPYRFNWKLNLQTLGTASNQVTDMYYIAGSPSAGGATYKYAVSSFNLSNFNNDLNYLSGSSTSEQSGYFGAIYLVDDDSSHYLNINTTSNLTSTRSLTINTGDASRTLTLSGNATISGTNTGDQDLSVIYTNANTFTALQTFTAGIQLNDNDRLYFGDGDDAELYYNSSTDTFIVDTAGCTLDFIAGSGNLRIKVLDTGGVKLYYGLDYERLETTSAGGTLTGTWNATTNLTINSANVATQSWVTSQGYTTNVGDITGVTAGTGLSGGGSSGSVTLNVSISGLASELTTGLADTDEFMISDAGVVKKMDVSVVKTYMQSELDFASSTHTHTGMVLTSVANTFTQQQTFDAGIQLNDNDSIYFGSGDDAQIYSNGTNVYLSYSSLFEIRVNSNPVMTFGYDYVELNLFGLAGPKILEIDSNEYIIGATKNTAYNKNFGTTSGTVAEGNHTHSYYGSGDSPTFNDLTITGEAYIDCLSLNKGTVSTSTSTWNVSGVSFVRQTSGTVGLETLNGGVDGQILVILNRMGTTLTIASTGNIFDSASLSNGDAVAYMFSSSDGYWYKI